MNPSSTDIFEHINRSPCPSSINLRLISSTSDSRSSTPQNEYLLHHQSIFESYSNLSLNDYTPPRSQYPAQNNYWEKQSRAEQSGSFYTKLEKHSNVDHGYNTLMTSNSWYKEKRFHNKCNPFDQLADDIVIRIFSFMKSSELTICARVCKRFEWLAWQQCLWKVITISGENVNADKVVRNVFRQLCGQSGACMAVQKVRVVNGARITDRGVSHIARRCPELLHLEIHGNQISNGAVYEILSQCQHLQHLDVTGCVNVSSLSPTAVLESKEFQIQYIDLTDCTSLADYGLKIIVQNCPHVAYLYLRRCVQISDCGLKYLPSFCTGLRELSVSDCTNITDFGLCELAKLGPILRYLSVAKCEQVSDVGLKVVVRRCYKLRYLNVRGCEAVSDEAILILARSCTRLRALDLGKSDVSDAGLRALAECCPNLKKLSVRNCSMITDRGIQSIAYYCRGLQQLNIQDCQISLEGYRTVKKYCKRCIIEHTNPGYF